MDRASVLEPSDFSQRSNQIIFESCRAVFAKGQNVDLITVSNYLRSTNRMDDIGGDYVINKLATEFSIAAHLEQYIESIKDRARLFKLNSVAVKIQKESESCSSSLDLLSDIEKEIYDIQKDQTQEDWLSKAANELDRQIENYDTVPFGISSGIKSWDSIYGGFLKSQYYVLGGRPSAGKTAMADQFTLHQLEQERPVLYIALESSVERVYTKIACKKAGLVFTRFQKREMIPSELKRLNEAHQWLRKTPFHIKRPSNMKASEIRGLIRREHRKNRIEFVVIDYLQKITIPANQDERRGVSEASKELQRACCDTGVPALALVQLNREGESASRPSMRHIKESGQIEQDADNVCFVWPEVDPFTLDPADMLPVILTIEKNKDGMRGIDQKLNFNGPLMTFMERK
jgi:replicative DNA helicase